MIFDASVKTIEFGMIIRKKEFRVAGMIAIDSLICSEHELLKCLMTDKRDVSVKRKLVKSVN